MTVSYHAESKREFSQMTSLMLPLGNQGTCEQNPIREQDTEIEPDEGEISPRIAWANVVFPDPTWPEQIQKEPTSILKSRFWRIGCGLEGYCTDRLPIISASGVVISEPKPIISCTVLLMSSLRSCLDDSNR